MNKNDVSHMHSQNTIFWTMLFCIIFLGLCVFFLRFHPLTLFNTDDWTYLSFTRTSKLLPNVNDYNPIKVLPENLMPMVGYFGKLLMPITGGYYDAIVLSMSLFFSALITVYVIVIGKLLEKKFSLGAIEKIALLLIVIFIHFIPFIDRRGGIYPHLFYEGNLTNVYNYTVPTLLNCIVIGITELHEEYLRHMFRREHTICKVVYMILIYLSVYSNLYSSIVIAAYASVKILQYSFVEGMISKSDLKEKLKQCFVYISVMVLWFISMIFEAHGDRAMVFDDKPFDLAGSFAAFIYAVVNRNTVFRILMASSVVGYIVLLIHVLRNRDIYLKEQDEKDRLCFLYVNYATLWIIAMLLTMAYIVLLSAKTGPRYFGHMTPQFDYYFFLFMNFFMIISYSMKKYRKSLLCMIALALVLMCMTFFSKGSYPDYNDCRLSNENCKALANYVIEQYIEADKKELEHAYIRVPDFNSSDNYPYALYGNMRIARTLYNYGITSRFIDSEFVIDESINSQFGL